jgi:hypothetical protein
VPSEPIRNPVTILRLDIAWQVRSDSEANAGHGKEYKAKGER